MMSGMTRTTANDISISCHSRGIAHRYCDKRDDNENAIKKIGREPPFPLTGYASVRPPRRRG